MIITTVSGENVSLVDPDPWTIKLEDIAHSLSMTCRFTGHIKQHYSIAHHCLLVGNMLFNHAPANERDRAVLALHGLLHDAEEAYVGDLSYPLKMVLKSWDFTTKWNQLTDRLNKAIYQRLYSEDKMPTQPQRAMVKIFDVQALMLEMSYLFYDHGGESYNHTVLRLRDLIEEDGWDTDMMIFPGSYQATLYEPIFHLSREAAADLYQKKFRAVHALVQKLSK